MLETTWKSVTQRFVGKERACWQGFRGERARLKPDFPRCAAALERSTTQILQRPHHHEHLMKWLRAEGAPEQLVRIEETEILDNHLDRTVAKQDLKAGDVVMRIPENLVITLDRVFQDEAVAELLTTNKLSELACLTLYLMYEKKAGPDSFWHDYIKELDRVRGRGLQGARAPLLWDEGQVESLLQGSPVVKEVQQRRKGIEREYKELDTVWFMAGSLFQNYPYDIPTEAFSLKLFVQAFAAVQASVVHLQGVPLAKRFALVPLGPPCLTYSSTSKSMLKYEPKSKEVQLVVERDYEAGEPITAWFGPQPNQRTFLNYGIVDEQNPHDTLTLEVTIPQGDPLFQLKRRLLQKHNLATQQKFLLQRNQGLPKNLLQYCRFAHCTDEESLQKAAEFGADIVSVDNEITVLTQLGDYIKAKLARYRSSITEDEATIRDANAGPRQKIAARLLKIEKSIYCGALEQISLLPHSDKSLDDIHSSHVVSVRVI